MSQFESALKIVHESLQQISGHGGKEWRASAQSLRDLVKTQTQTEPTVSQGEEPQAPSKKAAEPADRLAETPSTNENKAARLAELRSRAIVCEKCPHLAQSRTQVVFGEGNLDAALMFVGEAPGADEDAQGEPFVGKAGQLLTKIIETMGFKRSEVYMANVLKCRPDMPESSPGNREPTPDEMKTCLPYLIEQIDIIRPRLLVALGATAMEGLTGNTEPMGQQRGHWHEFQGIPLMATYHPGYLVHNPALSEKRKLWEDMLLVLERLGTPISEKQRGYFLPK